MAVKPKDENPLLEFFQPKQYVTPLNSSCTFSGVTFASDFFERIIYLLVNFIRRNYR